MTFSAAFPDLTAFAKSWRWFLVFGLVLIGLGGLALYYTTFTTLLSVIFFGSLIFASGVLILIDTFTVWWHRWRGFWLHLIMGLLNLFVGYILIFSPLWASISLTLLLGILYVMLGVFRIAYSISIKTPNWGWVLFSGIIALVLGLLILSQWPASGLFIIGLFVGIDLIFIGWAYVMAAMGARALVKR